jgi:hypothetical protein
MEEIVVRAKTYATQAHRRINQLRKYTKLPYDVHLSSVSGIVAEVSDDPQMIAAAWLHDVVEDTPATFEDIRREFGRPIMELVEQLTDVSLPSEGNRARRMSINREHLAIASPRAKTIKLADLIDNATDISKHDARFASTYLAEMATLLEVLTEGDDRLLKRARGVLAKCTEKLGLGKSVAPTQADMAGEGRFGRGLVARFPKAVRRFARVFCADDLAEPLICYGSDTSIATVVSALHKGKIEVAGIKHEEVVSGYIRARDIGEKDESLAPVDFKPGQVVAHGAPLSDVIEVLTRHEFCFVSREGTVEGVISRADIQKPIARMWLFGMVTVTELFLTNQIRDLWPDDSWTPLLSPTRLRQAQTLREERLRRGQSCTLLDCLQIGDKGKILLRNPGQLAAFGFESRRAGETVMSELGSLRNNLAHAQDIVSNDWSQIVRLARRLESIVDQNRVTST